MTNNDSRQALHDLEVDFKDLVIRDPRRAAEIAYVIARLHRNFGDVEMAQHYAKKSIELFESVGINTLNDAAAHYTVLADVVLPSLIHQDVVREIFSEYHL